MNLGAGFVIASAGPHEVAVLPLDLRRRQLLGQPQTGFLFRQRLILPNAALDLPGRRHQAGGVMPGDAQPVNPDAVFDALANRLGADLVEAVQKNRVDATGRVLDLRAVPWLHHDRIVTDANRGALRDDVQRRAVAVGWK